MSKNKTKTGQLIKTIGHSNHSLEKFVSLLEKYNIEVLVDVRSYPYSKYAPHFNETSLKEGVKSADIKYLFMGKELGGRPQGKEFYDEDGYVLYWRIAESTFFQEGIERLQAGIEKYRVAIMCSEENPTECHRRLLVGRVLNEHGVTLQHIRGDGKVQTDAELPGKLASFISNEPRQLSIFDFEDVEEVPEWKSTQSVLQKKQHPNFSRL